MGCRRTPADHLDAKRRRCCMHNDFNGCTTVTGRNEIGGLAHSIAVSLALVFAFSFSGIGLCRIYANQCSGQNEKRSEPCMRENTMVE